MPGQGQAATRGQDGDANVGDIGAYCGIAKVTLRVSIEEAPKYFSGDYHWDKRQPSWPEHYHKVRSIAATKLCHS